MTSSYRTPQFENLLPKAEHSEDAYDNFEEEFKQADQSKKESFIDLNDDNVIYQSNNKKALSPIQLKSSTQIRTDQEGGVETKAGRHRQSFQQHTHQGRPHSVSGDYSAITATSSNSASGSSAHEIRRKAGSFVNPSGFYGSKAPKMRSNNPINVI